MVRIGSKVIPTWVLALITGLIVVASVAAVVMFGQYKIPYEIQPAAEAPTLTPNPVTLQLGTIPSGSTGEKDFGNTATLSLPAGYNITFELETTSVDDFDSFSVDIEFYVAGTTTYVSSVHLSKTFNLNYETLDAGDYDLHVEISYTTKSVTSTTTGEVVLTLS